MSVEVNDTARTRATAPPTPPNTWLRRKGNIDPLWLSIFAGLASLPVLTAIARLLAYPGMLAFDAGPLYVFRQCGLWLNQSVTLAWVPPADRWSLMYLLLLPTATLIIAIARMTFGLRILGFRSILIAVGFQEIGILQSLALIAVVVLVVLVLRPAMRHFRLPLYARVALIIGIAAMIMVAASVLGPWLRSESVWSVAFFPVIILAMLAEGIARTIEADNALLAVWRTLWTLIIAFIIAVISQSATIREIVVHFPEVMLTQLIAIVFVSEFFDFRLFQGWAPSAYGIAGVLRATPLPSAKIAIVRNRWNAGVIGRLGPSAPTKSRVQSVEFMVDVLRDAGYTVKVLEGDTSLGRELRNFLPPDPRTGGPGGLILNLATGIQGHARLVHVPAMLEAFGIAYSGPDPLAHARLSDRYALFSLLGNAGVPVPRHVLLDDAAQLPDDFYFPLAVQPRNVPDVPPLIAMNATDLRNAIRHVLEEYGQAALVETHFQSTEVRVSLLGNRDLECLPLLQMNSSGDHKSGPAPVSAALSAVIVHCAKRAFAIAGCRDYARIDFRFAQNDEPRLVHIETQRIFARRGSLARAAECAGYSYADLMQRVVAHAWRRYQDELGGANQHGNVTELAADAAGESRLLANHPSN